MPTMYLKVRLQLVQTFPRYFKLLKFGTAGREVLTQGTAVGPTVRAFTNSWVSFGSHGAERGKIASVTRDIPNLAICSQRCE